MNLEILLIIPHKQQQSFINAPSNRTGRCLSRYPQNGATEKSLETTFRPKNTHGCTYVRVRFGKNLHLGLDAVCWGGY